MNEPDPVRADLDAELVTVLDGELEVQGRIMPASNATFLAQATLGQTTVDVVYKPVAGERPLWDFPDGTLAGRELAAYAVSEALGWGVVPFTVLREGPHGPGMVQLWREPDPDVEAVDLCPAGEVPAGYKHVLDASDGQGRPVSLVHEDSPSLRRMAVFDVVVNNADRKGGHVLAMTDGHRYGVDHGICFHHEVKLRTVLWGWAGQRLDPHHRAALESLLDQVEDGEPLAAVLEPLITARELGALRARCRRLLSTGRMPRPSGEWPSIPWPAF